MKKMWNLQGFMYNKNYHCIRDYLWTQFWNYLSLYKHVLCIFAQLEKCCYFCHFWLHFTHGIITVNVQQNEVDLCMLSDAWQPKSSFGNWGWQHLYFKHSCFHSVWPYHLPGYGHAKVCCYLYFFFFFLHPASCI